MRRLSVRPDYDIDRLRSFSDSVFAVAITLVVTALQVPDKAVGDTDLGSFLGREAPRFVSFGAGFIVIGYYWLSHHRTFELVVRADGRLLWLNLGLLFFVVLTPFPTELIGQYRDYPTAHLFFNLNATAIGLVNVAIWLYARRGRLVGSQIPAKALRIFTWRAAVLPIVFGLATALSLVSIVAAVISWSLLLVGRPLIRLLLGPMPPEEEESEREEVDESSPMALRASSETARERDSRARLLSFSDNVYAFALTLLVVHFTMAPNHAESDDALRQLLWEIASPDFVAYVTAFLVTGLFWNLHCKYFLVVDRQDGSLRVMNLLHLMAVALLPFTADLLSRYDGTNIASVVYALTAGTVSGSLTAMFWYASAKSRLVDPLIDPVDVKRNRAIGLVTPLVFLVSAVIAVWAPTIAVLVWFAPLLVIRLYQHQRLAVETGVAT